VRVTGRNPEAIGAVGQLEKHRAELAAHCRRILGPVDAEDALQDTFLRALRRADQLEQQASLRPWLYRIATNVCFDVIEARKRRPSPIDLGPEGETIVDAQSRPGASSEPGSDPADITAARETVRLAFVAALRHLPPKQRAALILCEVLQWKAAEVAELLETSVASVSSALQRARRTLAARDMTADAALAADNVELELVARFVTAFERYDMDMLTTLIREDAIGSAGSDVDGGRDEAGTAGGASVYEKHH
jgi:RNA polymerase sigma-70 factor, ECF subfamily